MTTRDNLRVEQVYFENLKRTMNELAAKKSELDGTMQTLAENAVAADENIIMLYKNLCEAWIEAENLFKKVDTDTQAITERIDSLEKEFNEKIDEVNNYIVSITRALDERLTQAEGDIDALEGRMDTAEGDIDALEGRMDTAEGDIDALEGRMDTAEGDIDALEGRMDTAEGDIDALEGRMDTAEGDIYDLEAEAVKTVIVTDTTPVITADPNTIYVCGTVTTLSFTPAATGISEVIFTSGTTPTVLTVSSAIRWANSFDPTTLEASTTYELNVMQGIGVAVKVGASV